MLDLHAAFARDYGEARNNFTEAAAARTLHVERHVHPWARGARGEELSIDAVLLGNPNAAHLLLLTSAMHGVEGFCGSGCQVALLRDEFIGALAPFVPRRAGGLVLIRRPSYPEADAKPPAGQHVECTQPPRKQHGFVPRKI